MAVQQDTIYIPLRGTGQSLVDVQLPQYYREGFFAKDSLFHPELPGGNFGVSGDPIPYSIRNDNVITSILLIFFIMMVIAYANTHKFFVRQLKSFFYIPHDGMGEMSETGNELRFQVFLVFLSSVMLSLLYFLYAVHVNGDYFILKSQYHLIAIYLAMMISYFVVKWMLYSIVNRVFFDGKRSRHWVKTKLFISSMESMAFFPAVLLQAYFNMREQNVIIYFVIVLIFVKILTFFKCYIVFFRRNVFELQIILYFCALEMAPLLAFWGALGYVTDSLKIIF
jgi:hypothetical protein